ncbi:MAG: pilus assembly protein [Chloroflexi bacterium]|nr:pilus assembly protein [Chloroflexota bacterium]
MERPSWPTGVRAGQGVVEYGLLVMSISVLVLGLFLLLGDQFGSIFSNVTSSI